MADNYKKTIRKLSEIINSSSEKPRLNDKRWIVTGTSKYKIMQGRNKYIIDDDMIKDIDLYSEIYMSIPNIDLFPVLEKDLPEIAIIYLAKVHRKQDSYIGYTTHSLLTFIKLNIHKKNVKEVNIFDNFIGIDIRDIRFSVLEFVNYKTKKDIFERKKYHKSVHFNKNPSQTGGQSKCTAINVSKEDKLYEKRIDVYYDVFNKFKERFTPFKGYIYKITCIPNKRSFIGGAKKDTDLIEYLKSIHEDNDNLKKDLEMYPLKKFKLEMLEKYDANSPFDMMLRVDYLKMVNNSILEGYNRGYCLDESEKLFKDRVQTKTKNLIKKNFFLYIQRYLFNKYYVDSNNYNNTDGYIYLIKNKNNNKMFYGCAYGETIKDVILCKYNKALEGRIHKKNKLITAISYEPYTNFDISIVKKRLVGDNNIDLNKGARALIKIHDTINNGYNIDNKDVL